MEQKKIGDGFMKKILPVGLTLLLSLSVCFSTVSKADSVKKLGIFSEFADGLKEGLSGKKEPSKKKYKKMCKSYSYSKLKKGKYKGKKIKIKGKIESVKEDMLDSDLTLIVKSGSNYYEVFMSQGYQEYSGYARGKTLSVWGTVKGTTRYVVKKSGKKNKKMTIPSIKSRYDKLS